MEKRNLIELYFDVLQHYEMFTQGLHSSLALALLNYNDYKARGGKKNHRQLDELKEELKKWLDCKRLGAY